jgi:hypothetical protein
MTNVYTFRVALIYTIELKEAKEKAIKAKMQLAIYYIAML